ncbi:MAG: Hsp20/alpha crystallin family protein [Candidatus Aenigmatarchaeota archaeon]
MGEKDNDKNRKRKWRFFWEEPMDELDKIKEEIEESFKNIWEQPFRFEFTFPRIRIPRFMTGMIREDENKIIARIPLPGFKKEEIDLRVTENSLSIVAEKKSKKESKKEGELFISSEESSVRRSYKLPEPIIPEKTKAKLEDGVLTVIMEKASKKEEKEKKIEIE